MPGIAAVVGRIAGRAGSQRAEAKGSEEVLLNRCQHVAGLLAFEQGEGQTAQGENLVGSQAAVHSTGTAFHINHIMEHASCFIPETLLKRGLCPVCQQLPVGVENRSNDECVDPQRLNLDRFAHARRYHPIADLGIHPGELHAWLTAGNEAVRVHVNVEARALAVALQYGLHCGLEFW